MSPLSILKNKSKLEDENKNTNFRGDGGILKAQSHCSPHKFNIYINTCKSLTIMSLLIVIENWPVTNRNNPFTALEIINSLICCQHFNQQRSNGRFQCSVLTSGGGVDTFV